MPSEFLHYVNADHQLVGDIAVLAIFQSHRRREPGPVQGHGLGKLLLSAVELPVVELVVEICVIGELHFPLLTTLLRLESPRKKTLRTGIDRKGQCQCGRDEFQ